MKTNPSAPPSLISPSLGPPPPPNKVLTPPDPKEVQGSQDKIQSIVGKTVYNQLNPPTQDFTVRLSTDVNNLVTTHVILVNTLPQGPLKTIGQNIADILPKIGRAHV